MLGIHSELTVVIHTSGAYSLFASKCLGAIKVGLLVMGDIINCLCNIRLNTYRLLHRKLIPKGIRI